MTDRFPLLLHSVVLLAAIAAVVALALFHLVAGDVAVAIIASAAGIVGGSGAATVGGNLALKAPEQIVPQPPTAAPNPTVGPVPTDIPG